MTCTIIIVAWNCWQYLQPCLQALTHQSYKNFDVIIYDNGDATEENLDWLKSYNFISYYKSPSNMGFAAGNNAAIANVASEWLVLLNPDTIPDSKWLEELIQATFNYPQCFIFGSNLIQSHQPHLSDGEGDCYHVSGLAWRARRGKSVLKNSSCREIFSPCAAAALYKTSVFRELQGFDEDFFCYMEDVDLGFRARLLGYSAMYVPTAMVQHVGSATTGMRSDFYIYHGQRNLVWVYIKNMPSLFFWCFLPAHLLLNCLALLRYGLVGKLKITWCAKYDAIKGLKHNWKKRKMIQKNRKASIMQIFKALNKSFIID